MLNTATVVGAFWGDEGKGKFVDYICRDVEADVAVRFAGGSNAGHTIKHPGEEAITMRLLPTGGSRPGTLSVIGAGVVIDPDILIREIDTMKEINPDFDLVVDYRAHIVLPSHRELDTRKERARGAQIGTTRSGIGPTYADKANRVGIRIGDLTGDLDELYDKARLLATGIHHSTNIVSRDQIQQWSRKLSEFIGDGSRVVNGVIDDGGSVVFAGAQGALLDIDFGTYPFVTSTSCLPSGIGSGAGVDPRKVSEVVGVVKAYCTRIGAGDFPTEIHDEEVASIIREAGNEYEHGVHIDRPRRIGWLDPEALELSARVGNYDWLAITMLDVIGRLDEIEIPGVGIMPGWDCNIGGIDSPDELPVGLLRYLDEIERISGCRVGYISVGADTSQVIDVRGRYLW